MLSTLTEEHENGSLSVRYAYDKLNRIIREDNRKLKKTYLYSYDNNGNILSKKTCGYSLCASQELIPSIEKNYLYNGDRLEGYDIKGVDGSFCGDTVCGGGSNASGGTNGFTYDALGNPILYKDKTLVWQKGRQLKSYDGLEFTYDGYGRRISKGSTQYVYTTNGMLLRQSDGTDTLEFIYDTSGVAGFKHNSSYYLYRKNIQGDIISIFGLDGSEKVCYTYDAWGNCVITKDTDGLGEINPIRYRGYYWDVQTGLYYLQTRYYDPAIGRFINADSVRYLNPKSVNGLNLYAYCGNNPVMNVDPQGCFSIINTRNFSKISFIIFPGFGDKYVVWDSGDINYKMFGMWDYTIRAKALIFSYSFFKISDSKATLASINGTLFEFKNSDNNVSFGMKFGTASLDASIDIAKGEFSLGATATIGTIGFYTEGLDGEVLIGSFGAKISFENGEFSFSLAFIIGVKITIRFW